MAGSWGGSVPETLVERPNALRVGGDQGRRRQSRKNNEKGVKSHLYENAPEFKVYQ